MASLPDTMKGIVVEKVGPPEVLRYKTDLPIPTLKVGEVLVKNNYIGVNFIDINQTSYIRSGLYPAPRFPYVPGSEGEGTIVATGGYGDDGESSHYDLYSIFDVDCPVVYWCREGAYAEYTAVPSTNLVFAGDGLPPRVGAAAFLQGLTALTLVHNAYTPEPRDWVLVHAAPGGTGLWLCQLLRMLRARVIITMPMTEKATLAREAGARHVIRYRGQEEGGEGSRSGVSIDDIPARVLEITDGAGVKAVYDGVGRATFNASLACLARTGSLVVYENISDVLEPVMLAQLSAKNAKLVRPTLFKYIVTHEETKHYGTKLLGLIIKDDNKIEVRIHGVYPLSEAARAHTDLLGGKTSGKLLLNPSN